MESMEHTLTSNQIGGIIICALLVPLFTFFGIFYLVRRKKNQYIRLRRPILSSVSIFAGCASLLVGGISLIISVEAIPCWVMLILSHLLSSLFCFPYLYRAWLLYFVYNLNQELKEMKLVTDFNTYMARSK